MTATQPAQDLRELRESKVLTQADLGSQGHVSTYESGKRMPGTHAIRTMADRLKVDPAVVHAACRESCRRASAPRPSPSKRAARGKGR